MAKLSKTKLAELGLHEKQTWHEVACPEGHTNYVSEPAEGFKAHAEKAGQPFVFECGGCDGKKYVLS